MPVFNDVGFYFSSHNPYSSSYPIGGGTLLPRSKGFNPGYFNYQNKFCTGTNSGLSGRYQTPNPRTYNPIYKFGDTRSPTFISSYITYSDWKDSQLASQLRGDNFRWKQEKAYRPRRPVFIDTSTIDLSKPKKPIEIKQLHTEKKENVNLGVNEGKPISKREAWEEGTIKRGRTVVRIFSKVLKENPYLAAQKTGAESGNQAEGMKKVPRETNVLRLDETEDSDDEDSDPELEREATVKRKETVRQVKSKESESETEKEEEQKEFGKITRKIKERSDRRLSMDKLNGDIIGQREILETRRMSNCSTVSNDSRRVSMELFEEQAAILDDLIKEELARKDADNYFSDPNRKTVKIPNKHKLLKKKSSKKRVEREESSNTDDDESPLKKSSSDLEAKRRTLRRRSDTSKTDNESEDSSSSSRRNSLFHDLIIEETIKEDQENCETKLEKKARKPSNVKKGTVKPLKKIPKISAIIEVQDKPKTPKFFIDSCIVESNQCQKEDSKKDNAKENIPANDTPSNIGKINKCQTKLRDAKMGSKAADLTETGGNVTEMGKKETSTVTEKEVRGPLTESKTVNVKKDINLKMEVVNKKGTRTPAEDQVKVPSSEPKWKGTKKDTVFKKEVGTVEPKDKQTESKLIHNLAKETAKNVDIKGVNEAKNKETIKPVSDSKSTDLRKEAIPTESKGKTEATKHLKNEVIVISDNVNVEKGKIPVTAKETESKLKISKQENKNKSEVNNKKTHGPVTETEVNTDLKKEKEGLAVPPLRDKGKITDSKWANVKKMLNEKIKEEKSCVKSKNLKEGEKLIKTKESGDLQLLKKDTVDHAKERKTTVENHAENLEVLKKAEGTSSLDKGKLIKNETHLVITSGKEEQMKSTAKTGKDDALPKKMVKKTVEKRVKMKKAMKNRERFPLVIVKFEIPSTKKVEVTVVSCGGPYQAVLGTISTEEEEETSSEETETEESTDSEFTDSSTSYLKSTNILLALPRTPPELALFARVFPAIT